MVPSISGWADFFYRRFARRVSYDRFEFWDRVEAEYPGRGMLVLTAHFGNFEAASAAPRDQGHFR